ncbi:uncharacterized protein LOC144421894 [Styela clava]
MSIPSKVILFIDGNEVRHKDLDITGVTENRDFCKKIVSHVGRPDPEGTLAVERVTYEDEEGNYKDLKGNEDEFAALVCQGEPLTCIVHTRTIISKLGLFS